MTSARSLVAGAAALGFAGLFTAPTPAFAAAAPCEGAANYAAQSGAELLKISRMSIRAATGSGTRPGSGSSPAAKSPASSSSAYSSAAGSSSGDSSSGDSSSGDSSSGDSSSGDSSSAGKTRAGDALTGDPVADDEPADTDQAEDEPAGDDSGVNDSAWTDVGLGQAQTALVTQARTNAAAVARILDGQSAGKAALTEPVTQMAPPDNDEATRRRTPSGRIGPIKVGAGEATVHARWDSTPDCTTTPGEASRSGASLAAVDVLSGLVRVPDLMSSVSTTALERTDDETRTVASATVTAGVIELADGHVRIRVVRPATLVTTMSANSEGEVRYRPATIEISGSGIKTRRLDTVGDRMEISLAMRQATESATVGDYESQIGPGRSMPLPVIPGLPVVGAPDPESTPATGPGTKLSISLGDVRQAAKGHARAARATAIKVAITQGEATDGLPADGRTRSGYGGKHPAVALTAGFGLLETAAMTPGPSADPVAGEMPVVSGTGDGLPVTGSQQAGLLIAGGVGLLLTGGAAMLVGKRRRDRRYQA